MANVTVLEIYLTVWELAEESLWKIIVIFVMKIYLIIVYLAVMEIGVVD